MHYLTAINNAMRQPVKLPLLPAPEIKLPVRARYETPLRAQRVTGRSKRGKNLWLPVGQATNSTWYQQRLLRIYRGNRSINL